MGCLSEALVGFGSDDIAVGGVLPADRTPPHTTSTRYEFPLSFGSCFAFRVTATDDVGNEAGAEAQSNPARVTKYYYHGGRRVAFRAVGVAEAEIT